MYPGGHPSVDAAVARLAGTLQRQLTERESLSLGVARRQIVIDGVATETSHPVLRALAERLHHHRLGAVVLHRGLEAAELSDALRAVAADPERAGERLGEASAERLAQWPHVRFYRVTYEQLQLTGDDEAPSSDEVRGNAAAQLWMGLARAAIETDGPTGAGVGGTASDSAPGQAMDDADFDADVDAANVARAINEHPAAQAYDQVVVGYMLQLTDELSHNRGGAGADQVRRRMSGMIRDLDPATLQRLLRMGGDQTQRARFLNHAADGLRPQAVLEVLRAAAETQGENISTSMLRLLRKLSAFADADAGDISERADEQVREQVRELLTDWSLDDPNPDAYTQALESMTRTTVDHGAVESEHAPEPLRIIQMGLEVEATGAVFWRAVDALIEEGRLGELFGVMEAAGVANQAVGALWDRLETTDHVRRLLTTDPIDFDSLDRIFARMPAATVMSLLLDRLSESTSRTTRMGLYQRVTSRGLPAVPHVMERLRDTRWFVLRNMLAVLNEIGSWPPDFSALQYARHPRPTVRREALEMAVAIPAEREQAICLALVDSDERTMRVGVNAARDGGLPGKALMTVLQRIEEDDLSTDVRATLLRLLGSHPTAPVIERLADFVVQERRLLGRPKLAPRSPEMLAAVTALAGMKTMDPRARTALELARASNDPAIRAAAGKP